MNYTFIKSFSLLIMLSMGCHAPKTTAEASEQQINRNDQIGFFVYRAYSNDAGVPVLRLIEQMRVDGSVKTRKKQSSGLDLNDLIFVQISDDKTTLDSEQIDDPLNQVVEYQLDSGELSKKIIARDSADFAVRVNLNPLATSVEIRLARDSTTILHSMKL